MQNLKYTFYKFSEIEEGQNISPNDMSFAYPAKRGDVLSFFIRCEQGSQFTGDDYGVSLYGLGNDVVYDVSSVFTYVSNDIWQVAITLNNIPSDGDWLKGGRYNVVIRYRYSFEDFVYCSDFSLNPIASNNKKSIIISYLNNEPVAEFLWQNGGSFTQVVRLGGVVLDVQFQNKREVYKKTDGVTMLLSSSSQKEFKLHTDLMPSVCHEALNVAFLHDYFYITSDVYSGFCLLSDYGDIDYIEVEDLLRGMAKIRIISSPYNLLNPNFD